MSKYQRCTGAVLDLCLALAELELSAGRKWAAQRAIARAYACCPAAFDPQGARSGAFRRIGLDETCCHETARKEDQMVVEGVSGRARFHARVALVTGAGQGIGRQTALQLAREGARVVVVDLHGDNAQRTAVEIGAAGGEALAVAADVSDAAQVQVAVQQALARWGAVDLLANVAGAVDLGGLEELTPERWDRLMAVNVKGAFLCIQAVLPGMKARRYGKIVNVSSSAGRSAALGTSGANYTASKAAVLGLTRHIAREAAPFGINVNAVAPGVIDTEMAMRVHGEQRLTELKRWIPLGRLGTAEDVANLILFLLSDEASFIVGATVDINGGALTI